MLCALRDPWCDAGGSPGDCGGEGSKGWVYTVTMVK